MYFWEENKMSLIKGIHHVALRPTVCASLKKQKTFYLDLLGLKVRAPVGREKYPA